MIPFADPCFGCCQEEVDKLVVLGLWVPLGVGNMLVNKVSVKILPFSFYFINVCVSLV